jgi:tetratricopeptide (TPR) repeat protein
LPSLQLGQARSVPGRIGQTLCRVWRHMGLDQVAIQRAAWSLPDFFSPRTGASLLRMSIFAENGQPDALLREADLQLLRDPHNGLALWARLDAIEGLGRWHSVRDTMRDISELFALQYSVDEIYRQAVINGQSRMDEPDSWFEVAILDLLRGRYQEAADMFGHAVDRLPNDPHEAAHVLGWQARATHLANKERALHETRMLLMRGLELAPDCGMLRTRLEGLPE